MQHACLSKTVSHQKNNATKRPIDLPHLPIAPKTEKSAADLPPTLLCKLLNKFGTDDVIKTLAAYKLKHAATQYEEDGITSAITHYTVIHSKAKVHTKQNKTKQRETV